MEEGRSPSELTKLSYQSGTASRSSSPSQGVNMRSGLSFLNSFRLSRAQSITLAITGAVVVCACIALGSSGASSPRLAMFDDPVPPPPPPAPVAPAPDPNAPPAPAAPAPDGGGGGEQPEGPPPPSACQTGMVADAEDVPEDSNEMKACYLICDNTVGATPCDVNTCKSACWFGNDFCYNSCMGGCQYQAVGLNNGSRMACDSQTCFSGCSYQCQKQCQCGVQKSGHCQKGISACMLDEAIPGSLIGDTVNYICSRGPPDLQKMCKNSKHLDKACQSGFGFAVSLVSYYYSHTMSTVPQTTQAGVAAVAAACDFGGFGYIKTGSQHPCVMNYKGYAGAIH
ncbi:hypothetical protein AAMO2058_000954100 [Amorphochlora amoebiformis]